MYFWDTKVFLSEKQSKVFFCKFYLLSSIFHIFPVFFHQLFQYFPHFSSVFFIGFSKCSQTCLICALLIHHFCLIHQGSLKTLKVLSLMPMLSYSYFDFRKITKKKKAKCQQNLEKCYKMIVWLVVKIKSY